MEEVEDSSMVLGFKSRKTKYLKNINLENVHGGCKLKEEKDPVWKHRGRRTSLIVIIAGKPAPRFGWGNQMYSFQLEDSLHKISF